MVANSLTSEIGTTASIDILDPFAAEEGLLKALLSLHCHALLKGLMTQMADLYLGETLHEVVHVHPSKQARKSNWQHIKT